MPSLLAVDPGLATGWCWISVVKGSTPEFIVTGESEPMPFLSLAEGFIERVDAVVCESFIITPQTGKNSQAPWSLELIGALRWLCHKESVPFVLQSPADAKSFANDARLERIGWKRTATDHGRDAQRHAVLWLARNGFLDDELSIGA